GGGPENAGSPAGPPRPEPRGTGQEKTGANQGKRKDRPRDSETGTGETVQGNRVATEGHGGPGRRGGRLRLENHGRPKGKNQGNPGRRRQAAARTLPGWRRRRRGGPEENDRIEQ